MHELETLDTYLEENEQGELVIKQECLDRLNELKKQKESTERELKTLSLAITEELKGHYNDTTKVSGYNFTVKGGFYDLEFDMETFKQENIELYIKYLRPHESKVSYSLVSATREKKAQK